MTTMAGRPDFLARSMEQDLIELEDWQPLTAAECRAWILGELGPAPEGQIYGISPCGIPVIYRTESLEAAVMSLHSVAAWSVLTALLDSPEAERLHGAARVDVCVAIGDRERAVRALEEEAPWAREYLLNDELRPWRHQTTWLWARDIARIVAARQEALKAFGDGDSSLAAA